MHASSLPATYNLYRKFDAFPLGKLLFMKAVSLKAPFTSCINPKVVDLKPGYCEMTMKKRRAVENHIGTVHAIAACMLCEVSLGLLMEVSLPGHKRWIPKRMLTEYLSKANTDLRAVCVVTEDEINAGGELPVLVNIFDSQEKLVMKATITVWLSDK